MADLKLFQIEKNKKDVLKTVLTNTIKMLTERDLLKKENLENNIKKIVSMQPAEMIYIIPLDKGDDRAEDKGGDKDEDKGGDKDESSKLFAIKIIPKKITAVSKTHGINEFLNKYKNNPKIIIVKNISKKANQYIINNYPNTEIFLEEDLMINLIDNTLVPKHELMDPAEAEIFYEKYNCKKKNMPRIFTEDPVAKYYNMKPGDLCRIIRPSETSGFAATYRLVVKGFMK